MILKREFVTVAQSSSKNFAATTADTVTCGHDVVADASYTFPSGMHSLLLLLLLPMSGRAAYYIDNTNSTAVTYSGTWKQWTDPVAFNKSL